MIRASPIPTIHLKPDRFGLPFALTGSRAARGLGSGRASGSGRAERGVRGEREVV